LSLLSAGALVEEAGVGDNKLKPSVGNGSKTDLYSWTQTLAEVDTRIPVPPGTSSKQLVVEMKTNTLKVVVKGQVLINDSWNHPIKAEDCMWTLDDKKLIILTIYKKNAMEWWGKLLANEPEIDTQKIVPENSKVEDLDAETQTMVRKMQEDQRRKMMGLPSLEEEQKKDSLKKFMAQHPEMDFSNAKIG